MLPAGKIFLFHNFAGKLLLLCCQAGKIPAFKKGIVPDKLFIFRSHLLFVIETGKPFLQRLVIGHHAFISQPGVNGLFNLLKKHISSLMQQTL